jgi:hypothetical protein
MCKCWTWNHWIFPFFRWTTLLSEEEEGGNVRSLIPRSRRKRAAQCGVVIELQRYTLECAFLALLGVRQRVDAVGTRVGCRVPCVYPWHAHCWPYIGFHTCP